jgi:hypothetical protein
LFFKLVILDNSCGHSEIEAVYFLDISRRRVANPEKFTQMNTDKRKVLKLAVMACLLLSSVLVTLAQETELYDPDFFAKNYQVEDGQVYILDPDSGERYLVKRYFSDSFENAASIRDLIGLERGWTSFTLQSPQAPTVEDYNKLADQILKGESGFLDNRVEPSSRHAHSGQKSLKTLAVAPVSGMSCTKASLSSMLMYYVKGDDVWYSAWYYYEKIGKFNTLMDLESTYVLGYPGMRICLNSGYLYFELAKWTPKSLYRQNVSPETPFPIKRWVHIKTRLRLSEGEDGIVQLWQDGKLIIDQRGQTLPFAGAVYNSLEIGLSAHAFGPNTAVLYVDDVVISDKPIE